MSAFIKSMIVWLSDFPSSPLSAHASIEALASPEVFNCLLGCLIGKTATSTIESYHSLLQKHLESKVETKVVLEMKELIASINFKKFFEKDLHTCVKVCVLLYFIGTHTSSYANLGITSLGFLQEEDKFIIEVYMQIHRNDRMISTILKDFDEFESTLRESQKESFSSLKNKTENTFNELQTFTQFQNNPALTKTSMSPPTSASSYVDEVYIDSILWENKLLEDTLYKLMQK
ncbi:hypothetical protein CLIB1423_02S08174 [[Candida] railenensis]|uniref:Uncharacterized protein n=1 Tax=[Candida] railenensis TaxID=45579 RepID=A0A9P0QKT2_9ASCO|nr:hypothetical protein CLIB1423_02S08174 [[Candida] railenensis]